MRCSMILRKGVPGFTSSGDLAVHLGETIVGNHHPLLGIEHGEALKHVRERRVELGVLRLEVFLMLQQQLALALQLLGRGMPLAQVADGVDVEVLQSRAERLARDLDGDRTARRRLQGCLPTRIGTRSVAAIPLQQVGARACR